jgi:peptidoglycan/LPS O-acetylase OafA/YrhL
LYINSINYFRGIAILFIVAGHAIPPTGWQIESFFEKLFINLVFGGAVLFVFISGFLFHHIFYKNFDYRTFMSKKVKNVLMPYLFLSTAPIIYFVFYKGKGVGRYYEYIFLQKNGIYYEYIRPLIMYYWSGYQMTAYWYVPFIMLLFLLSPLYIFYIRMRPLSRICLFILMLAIAVIVHRPVGNLYPLQSVLYFAPVYACGILCSIHRDVIYKNLMGKEIYLLMIILLLASLQIILFDHYGNFHKPMFVIGFPDIMIIQKLIMCIFFMVYLQRFENMNFPILKILASMSFSIYFLHSFVIAVVFHIFENFTKIKLMPAAILWLMIFLSVLMVCILSAKVIKAVFRSYSRQLIGW